MNQIQSDIKALLMQSNSASFEAECFVGDIFLNTESDVELIERFENDGINGVTFRVSESTYNLGDTINYKATIHYSTTQYASYQNFIQNRLKNLLKNLPVEDYIIYEEFYKIHKNPDYTSLKPSLNTIISFIHCLANKYYYRDNQIIIFAKTHCELSIQPNSHEKYIELAKIYTQSDTLLESLKKFYTWLSAPNSSEDDAIKKSLATHENERYAIAASEFVDNLILCEKSDRLFSLLKNIDSIYQSTFSKYTLYLDDFKFSKFNDKIAKHADDFLTKVNKVISDLQTQVLAIPVAVAVLATFKPNTTLNIFIFLAFFIYSIIIFYANAQQTFNLKVIKDQIDNFIADNKIPNSLQTKWNSEIKPINTKIYWHKIYLGFVFLFLSIIMWICVFCLINQFF